MSEQKSSGDVSRAQDEVISRVFSAPRALVFEVWTQAEHFARWFGPHGVETYGCEIADWPPDASVTMTVTLEDAGAGTRVGVSHRVSPPAAVSHPAVKHWSGLALQGWVQVLERLENHLLLPTAHQETSPVIAKHV